MTRGYIVVQEVGGERFVGLQERDHKNGNVTVSEVSLARALKQINQPLNRKKDNSSFGSSLFFLEEGLITELAAQQQEQQDTKNNKAASSSQHSTSFVVEDFDLPAQLFGVNEFYTFPESLMPLPCLVAGGAAARSSFHRDPLEWLGTWLDHV